MSYFIGKGHTANYVILSPRHKKYDVIRMFKSEKEAASFFDTFDYQKKRLSLWKKTRIFLCKHTKEYKLDTRSTRTHFLYCPDCSRGTYVDTETKEEREVRLESMWKNARKNEISELEAHILYEQAKVEDLKKQYKETYGEDY